MAAGAEPLDGPSDLLGARRPRAELGIDLVAGSIFERVDGPRARRRTRASTSDPTASCKAVYRKIHMFDVEVDGVRYAESAHEQPGDEIVVSELRGGSSSGMSVCYDLRFPELYRIAGRRGRADHHRAGAFTLATTRDHWEVLIRARAIENQCFVIAANQIGAIRGDLRSGGRSMIVDPWGAGAGAARPTRDGDRRRPRSRRRCATSADRLPSLANRRPTCYDVGWLTSTTAATSTSAG